MPLMLLKMASLFARLCWNVVFQGLPFRTVPEDPNLKEIAFSSFQKLSPTQEKHLVDWIRIQATLGLPPTPQQVKEFADRTLQQRGDPQGIRKNWIQAFLKRNPSINLQS